MIELGQLIGTETCSYCGRDDECLSVADEGDEERAACHDCIDLAFKTHWGEVNDEREVNQ